MALENGIPLEQGLVDVRFAGRVPGKIVISDYGMPECWLDSRVEDEETDATEHAKWRRAIADRFRGVARSVC